jgi:hypothetical protein
MGQGKSTYTFSAKHLPLSAFRSPPRLLALRGKRNVTENVYADLPGPLSNPLEPCSDPFPTRLHQPGANVIKLFLSVMYGFTH